MWKENIIDIANPFNMKYKNNENSFTRSYWNKNTFLGLNDVFNLLNVTVKNIMLRYQHVQKSNEIKFQEAKYSLSSKNKMDDWNIHDTNIIDHVYYITR